MLALAALALALVPQEPAALAGRWSGAFVRDGAVQLVELDLESSGGALSGSFDIPELGLIGEPLTELAWSAPKLSFRCLYGSFETVLEPESRELTGTNPKWGPPLRVHLKRVDAPVRTTSEEVRFDSGAIELVGTLVRPATRGPHPAIVVVCGSGAQGRRNSPDVWTYRSWGELFARRGFAALVYDKRGVGESGGDWLTCSLQDLAQDARAAFDAVARRPGIDAKHVGMMGISQGGWIAPLVANADPRVAFVVLLVGPAVAVDEQELDRIENTLRAEERGDAEIAEALAFARRTFDVAYGASEWSALEPEARAAAAKPWAEVVGIPKEPADLAWWGRNRYDPAEALGKLKCPVLAIYGGADPLVPAAKNAAKLAALLKTAGNGDVTIRTLPGVAHGLELLRRLTGDDWDWPASFWIWSRKHPDLYPTLFDWVAARTADKR